MERVVLFRPMSFAAVAFLTVASVIVVAPPAHAAVVHSFSFEGESSGGIGSATMDLSVQFDAAIHQWVLTAAINNTSPTTTAKGGLNISAITGFGFELDPYISYDRWTLEAQSYNVAAKTWGTDMISGTGFAKDDWVLGDSFPRSVELSYIAHVDKGVAGALYNPELAEEGNAITRGPKAYYTSATLTMYFHEEPQFAFFTSGAKHPNVGSPYVRMQRVGDKEAGSLMLTGVPVVTIPEIEDPGIDPLPGPLPTATPEPSSLLVWAGALAAMGLVLRRRRESHGPGNHHSSQDC